MRKKGSFKTTNKNGYVKRIYLKSNTINQEFDLYESLRTNIWITLTPFMCLIKYF